MYEAVRALMLNGLSLQEIQAEIERMLGRKLDPSTIKGWAAGHYSPYGRVYQLPEAPIPELAYLMGVNFGDTSRSKGNWHHNYTIRLRVTDEAFAREFARAASVVLGKSFKVWFDCKRSLWQTDVCSMLLYRCLTKPLTELKPTIEHCDRCTAAFIRGFFDAEGSSSSGVATCYNTNTGVLSYVKYLLELKFLLRVHGPHKSGPAPGTHVRIKGRLFNVNKQCYAISIGKHDSGRFADLIGFSIPRKQRGLLPHQETQEVGRGFEPLLIRSLTAVTAGVRVTAPPPHRRPP
jgi:DNA endonuclease